MPGLALKGQLPGGSNNLYSMIDFNALPQAYQPEAFSWVHVFMPVGAVVAIGLLAFGALSVRSVRDDTSTLTTQRNNLQAQINSLNSQNAQNQASITADQAQSTTLSTQTDGIQSQIDLAQQNDDFFTNTLNGLKTDLDDSDRDIREIVNDIPTGLNITDIEYQTGNTTVTGEATSQSIVMTYATSLRSSGRFVSVTITSIGTAADGNIAFTFILS